MPRVPLHFPFAGRRDDSAHTDQPQLTTPSAQNVRARDPVTGRMRGARRSALTKWNQSAIGSGPIRALISTAIDDRKIEYAFSSGAVTTDWFASTPSKKESPAGRVDSQGNVYAIDGNAGLVKYNSTGREIMKIALPVADAAHKVRALWVDDSLRIFAAVSEGGDVRTARMWCILQLQDNEYQILWTEEPGAYTEDLRVYRGSQLYAAHNYTLELRSRVLIYEQLGVLPFEAGRIESVAYPIRGMDVGEDGSVYCACSDAQQSSTDTFARRTAGGNHTPLKGWIPTDDTTLKVWSWYDTSEIDETDLEQTGAEATLDEGQQILRVRDKSGNNRHLYAGQLVVSGEHGPSYRTRGVGGKPCAFFQNTGGALAVAGNSLVSGGNASVTLALADQQRSAFPAYAGSMWCMVLLIRPTADDDVAAPSPRVVLSMAHTATPANMHALMVNRNAETALPGTYVENSISYHAITDNTGDAGGSGTVPPHMDEMLTYGAYDSEQNDGAVLVTILWDGGVEPNDTTKTRSLIRINGRPVDRCEGLAFESLEPTWIGAAPSVAGVFTTGMEVARRFQGELCEMIVVERRDRVNVTEPKVLTHDQYEPTVTANNTDQTDTQMARLEAFVAYGWGCGQLLRNNEGAEVGYRNYTHFYARNAISFGAGTARVGGPPKPGVGGLYAPFGHLLNTFALVSKHDAQGVLRWVWNWCTHTDTTAAGGVGSGVAVRKVGTTTYVWSMGNQPANGNAGIGASVVDARLVIDEGEFLSSAAPGFSGDPADGAWDLNYSAGVTDYLTPKMAADEFGNVYIPALDHPSTPATSSFLVVSKTGAAGLGVVRHNAGFTSLSAPMAVALPPDALNPDYRGDLAEEIAGAVYLLARVGDTLSDPAVYKLLLVSATALTTGSPRTLTTIAVVDDDVRLVTATTNVIPSGGSAAVDANAQFVQAIRAGDDIVILDGTRYLAYNLRTGVLAALASTSAGEIPPRGKLAMYWRHRLVIGNFADAPGNYAASRLGNIRDWNQRPGALPTGEQIQTSSQAFSGATTRAGEAEDSLVAMVPIQDDLAFLICESRILRLTGDPQDGGSIHKVTDSMGGVFGDSVCTDARGRAFMFGNKPPGLYQLRLEGDPIPLSRHTLEESEFADIDFSTHRILLAWNPIDRGVHIFQVAWGTSTLVAHWFWEEKTHRLVRETPLWTDRFYAAGKQPTAVAYLGGDDTRVLLFGCADGYIRKWDPAAATDDGDPVDGLVTMKVSPPGGPSSEYLLRGVQVALADGQGGARVEIFASEVADALGPIQEAFDIGPGLNDEQGVSHRAEHLFVRVRSAAAERWAFESAEVEVERKGKAVAESS